MRWLPFCGMFLIAGTLAIGLTPTNPGDLDGSDFVSIADVFLVANDLGKTSGFDPRADPNNDGQINIFDFMLVARFWGANYTALPANNTGYQIAYATYLGGSDSEELREPVLLSGGRLLLGSRTHSFDIPVTPGVYQPTKSSGANENGDMHLAILDATGSSLQAATFFGGSAMERTPYGFAVASNGDIVFTTGSTSPNIPTTASSYKQNLHSPTPSPGDGFVCRISGDFKTLRWCTYTGGGWPRGGLVLDPSDNVIITGSTAGINYPTTAGVVQTALKGKDDAFVLKLSSNGQSALWSTRLGGTATTGVEVGTSLDLLPNGQISVVGISQSTDFPVTSGAAQTTSLGTPDAFAARLSSNAQSLVYSTLVGGSQADPSEHHLFVKSDGSVLFAGVTTSTDFPAAINTISGGLDGYIVEVAPNGNSFAHSRYLGGSVDEQTLGTVVDGYGRIYLYGATKSTDYPVTPNALHPTYLGGARDGFLTILNADFSLNYSTYIGGNGDDLVRGVAVGSGGEIYLVESGDSTNIPTTSGAFQLTNQGLNDGYIYKLVPSS